MVQSWPCAAANTAVNTACAARRPWTPCATWRRSDGRSSRSRAEDAVLQEVGTGAGAKDLRRCVSVFGVLNSVINK